jgi:hypothetical protein
MKRMGLVVVAMAVIGAFMAVQGAAGAGSKKIVGVKRKITVQFQEVPGSTGDRVYGQLSASSGPAGLRSTCLAGQTVQIRHTLTKPGGGSPPPDLIATVKTDPQGAWELDSYEAAGATQQRYDTFLVKAVKHRLTPKHSAVKRVCFGAFGFITVPSD